MRDEPRIVERLTGRPLRDCRCGRRHGVSLRRLVIARDALSGVVDLAAEIAPRGSLLLLADPDTHDAAGEAAGRLLRAGGRAVRTRLLGREPKADDRTVATALSDLPPDLGGIVAVGAGTINDIGKEVARATGAPQITVATAVSMNGFASPVSAVTTGGLKVTRPAPVPQALLFDTRVLAAAPPRLARAGLGDLISKPVSGADWVLAGELFGETVCPLALDLAGEAVARARAEAAGIGAGDPAALALLAEALVISGISMELAGSSSPASGGEHLLSHYLDISAGGWGRRPRLHGEQVAAGTRASLALYALVRARGRDRAGDDAPPEETDGMLRSLHAHLPPSALEALLEQARAKRARRPGRRERRALYAGRWEEIWEPLDRQLRSSDGLDRDLAAASVPASWERIGVPEEMARMLIPRARHMRNRFTVLDLAADLGLLDEAAETLSRL